MVRITDLPDYEREHLLGKNLPPLGPDVWFRSKRPLSELRIALITTAGLHFRDDPAFNFTDATFRPIAGNEDVKNISNEEFRAIYDAWLQLRTNMPHLKCYPKSF